MCDGGGSAFLAERATKKAVSGGPVRRVFNGPLCDRDERRRAPKIGKGALVNFGIVFRLISE